VGYIAAPLLAQFDWVINEWWNGKDVQGNGHGLDTGLVIGWRNFG
jgi:hypothetical protein